MNLYFVEITRCDVKKQKSRGLFAFLFVAYMYLMSFHRAMGHNGAFM